MERKPSKLQEMKLLQNEIHNVEIFIASAVKESMELDETRKHRQLTKTEQKKANSLIDYIHEKNIFIVKAKEKIRNFYAPASV